MKVTRKLITIFFMFFTLLALNATHYQVESAGEQSMNGLYLEDVDQLNGYSYYHCCTYYRSHYLYRDAFGYWVLSDSLSSNFGTNYYYLETQNSPTPLGNWISDYGIDPAPTVSEYTDEIPIVKFLSATEICYDQAMLNATIELPETTDAEVKFEYGYLSEREFSVPADQSPISGNGDIHVDVVIHDLYQSARCYYRAVVITSNDTIYSVTKHFITSSDSAPDIVINPAVNVTPNSAHLNGMVNAHGNTFQVSFKYWITENPDSVIVVTAEPEIVNDLDYETVSKTVTNLQPFKEYSYKILVKDYPYERSSSIMTFQTTAIPPTVITNDPIELILSSTELGAEFHGIVNPNNLSTSIHFEYVVDGGSVYQNVYYYENVNGYEEKNINIQTGNLEPLEYYNCRIVASNSAGTSWGNWKQFQTYPLPPTITTEEATNVSHNSAVLNGTINPNWEEEWEKMNYDGLAYVYFEYGTTLEYGNVIEDWGNPYMGNYSMSCSRSVSGLQQVTTYHYRIKAVNDGGVYYGEDKIFITSGISAPVNIDIECNKETNQVSITWQPVMGASSYKVYSSTKPYTEFTVDDSGIFTGPSWIAPESSVKKYYYVTAVQ